jgi:ribonuclease D
VIDLKPFAERGDLRTSTELAPLRDLLAAPKPIKIAHNAKFDAKWVSHHLGVSSAALSTRCSPAMIAAGDQDGGIRLAMSRVIFSAPNSTRANRSAIGARAELSQSQIEYARADAATMIPLREKIVEQIKTDEL